MSLRDINTRNWHILRQQPLSEIAGALGDLGIFLPILVALAVNKSISFSSTLIFSGLFNILTGVFFGIPLPVQPMKAIAAVAIANGFSTPQTTAAGLFVGACILVFSLIGLLRWFAGIIPIPVIQGLQVGAGLSLIITAAGKTVYSLSWVGPSWADNYIWVIVAFLGLLVTNIYRRMPYALIVLVLGFIFAFLLLLFSDKGPRGFPYRLWHPSFIIPKGLDWRIGAVNAGIGQIPLTTLNSVIAVVDLAAELLPSVGIPSVTSVGLSVAGMNLVGCWFGAMPVCHGSGGLAAQYQCGARSGASVIVLGTSKLIIGLLFGDPLVRLLQRFPVAFLAVMLIGAGLELARVGESLNTDRAWDMGRHTQQPSLPRLHSEGSLNEVERRQRWIVMLVTMGFLAGFKNATIGFLAGMLCHWSFELPILLSRIRERWNEGRIRISTTAPGGSSA